MAIAQIQTWPFGSKYGRGVLTQTIGDPSKAEAAIRAALESRNVKELCAWLPDRSVLHVDRTGPDAPWRVIKGVLP